MQSLIGFLQEGATYIIACVILLGVLIFVHELGHFLVARWCGVRVEVFSLGFGRKIWKKTVGDTTYCISIFPIGGYVKMFGDQPGDTSISEADKAFSFTHKTVAQRIAIVLAGPLTNLFFAIVIFALVAVVGMETRAPVLGDVEPNTLASNAGFRSGDRINIVGGQPVVSFEDVAKVMDESIGKTLTFNVTHNDGTSADVSVMIKSQPNPNPVSTRETVGEIEGLSSLSRAALVGVPKDSPLWAAGLRSGDRVTAINGQPVLIFRDLEPMLNKVGGDALSMDVERADGSQSEKLTVTLAPGLAQNGYTGLKVESSELYLDRVMEKSPAEAAGLVRGDRLVSLNGKTLTKWEDVLDTIRSYKGEGGLVVDFNRDGEMKSVKIEPQITSQVTPFGTEDKRYTIGITPKVEAAMPETILVKTFNPIKALQIGVEQSYDFTVLTLLSFVRLFQSKISPKTLGGVLSIGQAAGETIKMGFSKFLTMMAIISINLFVLNLLPVPVLDGGHLVFYTIEAVKGSPLSLKKMEIAQQVGLVLLMGLMVFALFNDVTRLIFGRL